MPHRRGKLRKPLPRQEEVRPRGRPREARRRVEAASRQTDAAEARPLSELTVPRGRSTRRGSRGGKVQASHETLQGGTVDAEGLGGPGDVASVYLESRLQELALQPRQRLLLPYVEGRPRLPLGAGQYGCG